jgi:pimeloyl-ACP methyl ester carboxylesterase
MHRRDLLKTALPVALVLGLAPRAFAAPVSGSDRFSVVVEGQGPDLILIPGLTSSRSVFDGLAAHLGGRFRLHRVQLAGFAGEPAGGNAQGEVVAPVVEDLARYIAANRLHKPIVIGHSLGGEAGLALAARHPDSVGRLMVVDAMPFISVLFFGPTATPDSVRPQATAIRDAALTQTPAQYAAKEGDFIANMSKTEAARPSLVKMAVDSDRGVVARAMYDLMVTDLTPELKNITAPTTIVYAFDQKAYPVPAATLDGWYQAVYASLKGVKLVRIDDTFHFLMIDQKDKFEAAVDAFVA